ncbi:hypothetical protein LCGC14_0223790 [marine sediment metagenome]|uniref:Uncharacterized protein n=1 Tax=marine sediment metagenome TaxID=412755 RepID=A0A0F9WWQ7_9ZZZZ
MAIIQRSGASRIDPDTIRFVDRLDTDLSHYFEINVDDTNNLIDFLAKIGDFRFKDADDSDNSDTFQIVADDAGGSVIQKTSMITDGTVYDIIATGTITGAVATVDIDYISIDLDSLVLNDAATSALTIVGQRIDFNGATLTAITLSTVYGLYIDMPTGLGVASKTMEGAYIIDGEGHIAHLCNGSMAVSAMGINEEKYYKCEDFDEEAAAVTLEAGLRTDEWAPGGLNDTAADVTYIQDQGGVIQLKSRAADNDSTEITWLSTAVNIASNPILEFRVNVDAITASLTGFFVGITETANIQNINDIVGAVDDFYVVGMNSDLGTPANLRAFSEDNNGGLVTDNLGVAIAATWCTIRMDFTDTEQPRVWINTTGGAIDSSHEIAAATITGTVQDSIYVFPVIFVQCLDVTPTQRTLLVDYCKIWQDRS